MGRPKTSRLPSILPALPPVMCSARATPSSTMKPKASVAMARYMPFTRSAGRPTMMPVMPATSAEKASETAKGQPSCCR